MKASVKKLFKKPDAQMAIRLAVTAAIERLSATGTPWSHEDLADNTISELEFVADSAPTEPEDTTEPENAKDPAYLPVAESVGLGPSDPGAGVGDGSDNAL